jgi:predicted nucleic acid-binding protein
MNPVLFDSSVYIDSFRSGAQSAALGLRFAENTPVWLSSVVLEELYAGARRNARRMVERLERDFVGLKRILVPNLSDWTGAGRLLALLAVKYDYEKTGLGRLTNDALIAMSARRLGITVITANARDFARLPQLRSFRWRVSVAPGSAP